MVNIRSVLRKLKMVLVMVFTPTSYWMKYVGKRVQDNAIFYRGLRANLTPFEFLDRLDSNGSAGGRHIKFPNFALHDFSGGDKNLEMNWNTEPEVSLFLAELAFRIGARVIVETGSFVGYTSSHLACALAALDGERELFLIDCDRRFLNLARRNLEQLGLMTSCLQTICGSSQDPEVIAKLPPTFDFAFIDSDHSYSGVAKELRLMVPRLSSVGCIAVHDSVLWPGVRQAVNDLIATHDVFTFATSHSSGLSIIRKRR